MKEFSSEYPFEYSFFDEVFDRVYRSEQKLGKIINIITFLAIFIACLGLLGLSSFITEQRTKEIAVRKVLGAKVTTIVTLLSREFMKWIVVSSVIAWPIGYIIMNLWLQNFAYRADINILLFFVSAGIALLISVLTISFQSIKAAVANPVDSLRCE
ncbi:MAG: FtsX-like permease family protein [bacterium]|nr:FtsX-like permease family protein [bacterium]